MKPPGGVAPDLGHGQIGVGEEGDAERHNPVRVGLVPCLEEPVVPGAHAGQPQIAIGGGEEDPPAEAGYLGREVHRCPHPVDVHVAHARLDVEAARFQPVGLGATAGDGIHAHLRETLVLECPDLVALGCFDDTGGAIGQPARDTALEGVRRLDHVIIDRDDRRPHPAGSRLGEEEVLIDHDPLGIALPRAHPLAVRCLPWATRQQPWLRCNLSLGLPQC